MQTASILLAYSVGAAGYTCQDGSSVCPKIGIAYSGGGITGMLCSLCLHHELTSMIPGGTFHNDVIVSTASGGSIGYLIHQTTPDAASDIPVPPVEYPLPLSPNLTYGELNSDATTRGYTWWANAVRYIPEGAPAIRSAPDSMATNDPDPTKNWWKDVMLAGLRIGYRAAEEQVGKARGLGHLVQNFAVVRASSCPVLRNSSGVMVEAAAALRLGAVEVSALSSTPRVAVTNGPQLALSVKGISVVDGAAWSSAFWAAGILESSRAYENERKREVIHRGLLLSTCSQEAANETLHLVDGGFVDTTGIVALLQRNVSRIIAFYSNNDALAPVAHKQSEDASIAYLFGVDVRTDTMNSLAGPQLTQVFPFALYAEVMRNLTDPALLKASLFRVPVLANAYLNIPAGTLEELIIFSNEYSDEFVATFVDPQVRAHLNPHFPNRIPVGMSVFDANLLCEFKRWQLQRHADEVLRFFGKPSRIEFV